MKTIYVFFLMLLLGLGACNNAATADQEGETTTADTTATDLTEVPADAQPTNFFFQAIQALENGDREGAVAHLQSGISLLTEEGAQLEGEQKEKLATAITSLEAAKTQLQQGQIAGVEDLKKLIMDAEAYAPHKLLADAPVGQE